MQKLFTIIQNSFIAIVVLCFIIAEILVTFFPVPVLAAGIPLLTITGYLILKYEILKKQYNENSDNKCNDSSTNNSTEQLDK